MDNLLLEIKAVADRGYTLEFCPDGMFIVSDRRMPWQIGPYESDVLKAIKRANDMGVNVVFRGKDNLEISLIKNGGMRRISWLTPWKLIEQANLDIVSFDLDRSMGIVANG